VTTYRSGDWFLRGASGNENPIQLYAANGFMVLSFDVGKTPSVRTGEFKTTVRIWSSPTASIENAVNRLCDAGIIDPSRIGIAGYSHGAEIMAYAISHTKLFSAAIGDAGGRDPYFYYMAGKTWQDIFQTWGLGGWPEGRKRKRWDAVSPTLNANRIKTPLLMNAADSEFIADLALVTSLQQLGRPVELFIYADELHVKNQPKHRYEIYERNLDWFSFWLKGSLDSSPDKIQQYQRWCEMRSQRSWAEGRNNSQCSH
jgi:dipeptidyl aminopeptidase/acylaminoacyl peptidase